MEIAMRISKNPGRHILHVKIDGELKVVLIPKHLEKEDAVVKNDELWMGRYRYEPASDTWEKVSKILLLLMKIWNVISEVFKPNK